MTRNPLLQSIDWGTKLSTKSVDVYFAPSGVSVEGVSSLGWSPYEIAQAMLALQQIEKVANITFNQTFSQAGAEFRLITYNLGSTGSLGLMYPPGTFYEGLAAFNPNGIGWDEDQPGSGALERGGFAFSTLVHEFAHGLGLAHPHDNGGRSTIMEGVTSSFGDYGRGGLNQTVYTVMSYNSGWSTGPMGSWVAGANYGYEAGPMALDIALLQQKYGANMSWATGDDVYLLPSSNGLGTFYEAIWDAGGTDEIRASGSTDVIIDLRPASLQQKPGGGGYVSYAEGVRGGFTIAARVGIENATGAAGDDRIIGNGLGNVLSGEGGADVLSGKAGNDTLIGGPGGDVLNGGAGNDLLQGGAGADILRGQAGRDRLEQGGGADRMIGGAKSDVFVIDDAAALGFANGGKGNDLVILRLSDAGHRVVFKGTDLFADGARVAYAVERLRAEGGLGDDRFVGGKKGDYLWGSGGQDVLIGRKGNDKLFGGSDGDVLSGGAGRDWLDGGAGDDLLIGGAAGDIFDFTALSGTDTVRDFRDGDLLRFSSTDLADFGAFRAAASTISGDTVVALAGGTVILDGVVLAEFSADDFQFV